MRSIPGTAENGMTQAIIYARGNHLTEVSNEGTLVPELAESFESSNGAQTWVFDLRKGVEFHNGKTIDRRRRDRDVQPSP